MCVYVERALMRVGLISTFKYDVYVYVYAYAYAEVLGRCWGRGAVCGFFLFRSALSLFVPVPDLSVGP